MSISSPGAAFPSRTGAGAGAALLPVHDIAGKAPRKPVEPLWGVALTYPLPGAVGCAHGHASILAVATRRDARGFADFGKRSR